MISLVLISFFCSVVVCSTAGNQKPVCRLFFNSGKPYAAIAVRNDLFQPLIFIEKNLLMKILLIKNSQAAVLLHPSFLTGAAVVPC
ncbi:hypothetical protein DDI_3469 [Dickeya dianthicola RNS04.9]|nr:hypothetical protein DDI_3469 [Dickeya dianthicola RNS04.9]